MGALEETYRDQRKLDIVFALSCLALVASMIWMFAKDHNREFKKVQRKGFDVEVALLEEQAQELERKGRDLVEQAEKRVQEARSQINESDLRELRAELDRLLPETVKKETELAFEKAVRDSWVSIRDDLTGQYENARRESVRQSLKKDIEEWEQRIADKNKHLEQLQREVEALQDKRRQIQGRIDELLAEVTRAESELKRRRAEQDRLLRLAEQRRMTPGAKFRAWPIVDAFNSPYRVRQYAPEGLTIDYNFKQVQRQDRCATCHMFIDRQGFEKAQLTSIAEKVTLQLGEYGVYCNHPRLDLFAGSSSPHPAEKFGCTICHAGQGGAATFNFAFHFPDGGKTDGKTLESYVEKKQRWQDTYHWHASLHPDYLWDMPMIPMRFIESSCVKCHHNIADLVRTSGREEAPKLLRGYRLVRELGCFGCHEISGYKAGRPIGPDLRLEPYPAPDELSPMERAKLYNNSAEPPGQWRKVGPGLRRIAEKTTPQWTARWIRSPRSFRPDTRMPHFFGLTNNHPDQLSDLQKDLPSQVPEEHRDLPDAEIQAITFYLFKSSEVYLDKIRNLHALSQAQWQKYEDVHNQLSALDDARRAQPDLTPREPAPDLPAAMMPQDIVDKLLADPALMSKLTKDQLASCRAYLQELRRMRRAAASLAEKPFPPPELLVEGKPYAGDPRAGRLLFENRGCLACHAHNQIEVYNAEGKLLTDSGYGPDLSHVKSKLGNDRTDAAKWLYYWLTDPTSYHPRTYMPKPQLEPRERMDIVAWLLGEGSGSPPPEWQSVHVDSGNVEKLARLFLDKALTKSLAEKAVRDGLEPEDLARLDSDEAILLKSDKQPKDAPAARLAHAERLRYYAGRKTISRYGCYACHDIPGFENAKPIGTPLNDWGKKDPERLAFENIVAYVERHHGEHYDPFFLDMLREHRREGFLYQKLREPRSYDYEKLRAWDDRLRMPQFRFAHPKKHRGESDEEFARRTQVEEQQAIEAVMTFILGLVAEQIPEKYVYRPSPDRLHEIRGITLLERYNCIGCHITKPGGYLLQLDRELEGQTVRQMLQDYLGRKSDELRHDHPFYEHSAWRSQKPVEGNTILARGLPFYVAQLPEDEPKTVTIDLYEALRFVDDKRELQDFPAGLNQLPGLPADWEQFPPTGGRFTEVLFRLLAQRDNKDLVGERKALLGAVPPVLYREGQKVQPQWLYEFLRQPQEIRPAVARNLRMPRFHLSDDELAALVNYFIAVDRLENPALGLDYLSAPPAVQVAQGRVAAQADYLARLQQMGLAQTTGAGGTVESGVPTDYFEVGWRMLTDTNLCLKCHDIGTLTSGGKPEERGPALAMAAARLRPDYVERWIALPQRFLPYTLMPQYDPFFAHDQAYLQMRHVLAQRHNRGALQGAAVTGLLAAPIWPGALARSADEQVYSYLASQYAFLPLEKVRAVRDALMSWGYLEHPPPSARAAGVLRRP
ncbi:MAG: hypothetical protein C4296_12905 [Gemmataceae bacterium]